MDLRALPLFSIDTAMLKRLCDEGVAEDENLDFKERVYDPDGDKREFLKDVVAMANSGGGVIAIGVREEGGIAKELVGVASSTVDGEIQRMENQIIAGTEPRLGGYRFRRIPIDANRECILLGIPDSWEGPHRISREASNRFYRRHYSGTHEASYEELKTMFGRSHRSRRELSALQLERLALFGRAPEAEMIRGDGRLVVHLVSIADFFNETPWRVSGIDAQEHDILPFGCSNISTTFNVDGAIVGAIQAGRYTQYTQLHRRGFAEVVYGELRTMQDDISFVPGPYVTHFIVDAAKRIRRGLDALSVTFPIWCGFGLAGVSGTRIATSTRVRTLGSYPAVKNDRFTLPSVIVQSGDSDDLIVQNLRPTLDALWNAAGVASCTWYDKDGNWNPPPDYRM